MSSLLERTTAPTPADRFYYADNPFHASGVGMPNCTAYAWGRFWEATGIYPATLSLDNAENWYLKDDGLERGTEPKIGSIICWSKGAVWDGSDGAGHVGFVERVFDDGSILTSESGYGDERFWWTRRRYPAYNWGGMDYTFQGFIYPPIEFTNTIARGLLVALLWKMSKGGMNNVFNK